MSKVKTVMVDDGGIISYPQNFKEVNNFASFGSNVDADFKDIAVYGTLGFGSDTGKISFWGDIMSLGINTSGDLPYGVIDCYGLQLPGTIINRNGLSFYTYADDASDGQPAYVSIYPSGITSIGSLTIEQNGHASAWEFKNGTIRNWNMYCESEIKSNNVILDDGGNGYSTIDLIAKKYSKGSLDDSISIGLNGSTKTVKVSDNATVQLPANTTIGGNTPATFGSNVNGSLNQLTVQKISNFDNNADTPLELNAQIINLATTDYVWFNGGSISVDPKTSSFGIADYSNILKLNRADEGWITVDGTLSLYKDKIQYSSETNVPYISFSNKNIKLYSFDENLYSESSFTLATDKIEIKVGQGDINLDVGVGSININSGNGLYMTGTAEVEIESENQVIINAGNDIKIGTDNDYSDSHSITFGSKFSVPVYTCDDEGNYTKVKNEYKAVRCIKNTVNGKVTYTLELA